MCKDRSIDPLRSPIFVIGVGRSGTSLVQSMLASHQDVAFGPETSIFRRLVGGGALRDWLTTKCDSALIGMMEADAGFRRTGLDAMRVLRVARGRGSLTAGAVYRALLGCVAEDLGKAQVGDKDPRAIEWIGLVPWVADRARIVHVVRDPRDVVVSKTKAAWSKDGSFIKHLFANRVQIRIAINEGPQLFGSRYCVVIYEDLLEKTDDTLRKLCSDLSIRYDRQMIKFYQVAERLVAEDEYSWKKETLGPLNLANQGKWRDSLTPYQVALTERITRVVFHQFYYQESDARNQLTQFEKARLELWSALVCVADPVYRLYRSWCVRRARRFV